MKTFAAATAVILCAIVAALALASSASAASPDANASRAKAYCYKTDYASGINVYTPCYRSSRSCSAAVRATRKANARRPRRQRERIFHGCRRMKVPAGNTVRG